MTHLHAPSVDVQSAIVAITDRYRGRIVQLSDKTSYDRQNPPRKNPRCDKTSRRRAVVKVVDWQSGVCRLESRSMLHVGLLVLLIGKALANYSNHFIHGSGLHKQEAQLLL